MIASATVLLLFLACLGFGAVLLRACRVLADMDRLSATVWSFAAGLGVLGWLAFFAGIAGFLTPTHLIALCAVGLPGLLLFRAPAPAPEIAGSADRVTIALALAIALVLVANLIYALAPPADADSLAYHFALPKRFLAAGRIEFVPIAVDGAVPLLLQSTYMVALGIGGELAMTLWAGLVSAMAMAACFVLARRFLTLNEALALTLVLYTTPAVIYGAGSGQMEPKLILFALGAAHAVIELKRTGKRGYAWLAGAFAGFYAGAKYLGLLFVAAAALPLLFGRKRIRTLACYGAAAFAAGSQWYFWNWVHTGDPVFPGLYGLLHLPDGAIWTHALGDRFKEVLVAAENPLPKTPWLIFTYPLLATLAPPRDIESGRVGLGVIWLLLAPFAAAGVWRFRRRLMSARLIGPVSIAAAFYLLWLFIESSERVRHLLPVYPLVLLALATAAVRWADRPALRAPLAFAVVLTVAFQMAGQAVFTRNDAQRLFTGESRDAFLARNVMSYDAVPWINANLSGRDRILVFQRELAYLLDVPSFVAQPFKQNFIDSRLAARDPRKFLEQIRRLDVTHILFLTRPGETHRPIALFVDKLIDAGCGRTVAEFATRPIASRTLAEFRPIERAAIFAFGRAACAL